MLQDVWDDFGPCVAQIPLFSQLSDAAVDAVARAAHKRTLDRGTLLYLEGDRAATCHYLTAGQVKRAVSSADGGEKIIDIAVPGDLIGLAEVFTCQGFHCRAEAVEPATVIELGKSGLEKAMALDHRLAGRIIAELADRNAELVRDIASTQFYSGGRRVLDFLRQLAGPAAHDGAPVTFELPVRKHLMAARLGLTPETLSRTFRDLSDAGVITVCGRFITLSHSAMATLLKARGDTRRCCAFARERRST